MQKITDRIQERVEKQLNEAFKTFEVIESRLGIKTDNDGQIKVKASPKETGSGVQVNVEEYNKGSRAGEGGKEKTGKMTVES